MNPNIDSNTISFRQIRAEHRDLVEEILTLKKDLRSPWGDSYMGAAQNRLRYLKKHATQYCILRAFLRGKQHLADESYCREIALRLLPRFTRSPAPMPAQEAAQ